MEAVYHVKTVHDKKGYMVIHAGECYGCLRDKDNNVSLLQGKVLKKGFEFDIDEGTFQTVKVSDDGFEEVYNVEGALGQKVLSLTNMKNYITDEEDLKQLGNAVMKEFYDIIAGYLDETYGITKN